MMNDGLECWKGRHGHTDATTALKANSAAHLQKIQGQLYPAVVLV